MVAELDALLWVVLGVALVISVVTDILQRRILDVVTYPALIVALGLRVALQGLGDADRGLLSGLVGAVLAGGFFAFFAWRGRMGWGDVKLVAVVGAALGYPGAMAAMIFISLVGAVQAVVTLLWRGKVWVTLEAGVRRLLPGRGAREVPPSGQHIPYGLAIALGSVWTFFWQRAGG